MTFDPAVILDNWPLFLQGALMTVRITAIAFVGGLALACLLSAAWFVGGWPVRAMIGIYLAILRGVRFIILIFLVHFGLPFAGIRISALFNGTLALTLYASAYYMEVIRATVLGLPRGQWDSARAIGMSPFEAVRHVIAPQVLRPAIPPVVNVTITMIKESSVISAITVGELTYQGLVVQGRTFAPFEVFVAVAGLYWLITFAFSRLALRLERGLGAAQGIEPRPTSLSARYLSLEARPIR
jgi:His/Glu/Gln/Arg/opine family amino acid ABC transporter permease subunit